MTLKFNSIEELYKSKIMLPIQSDYKISIIILQVLYQEPNPGIVYRYVIPGNTNLPKNSHLAHNAGIILI